MVTAERRGVDRALLWRRRYEFPRTISVELGRKILGAFEGPRNDWRTSWGIAEEIGVSEGDVLVYIDRHPDWFLRDVFMDSVIYSNTVKLSHPLRAS